ncbi:MAG TPA: hypothetical protein VFA11_01455 [Acidimicrobiales bacterium]|nr:hypothetical protein [Acidimicrobiales bacterium]
MTSRRGDTGSALVLVPATVLILLALGALVVDAAVVFLGERSLQAAAATAATDAVSQLDDPLFYRSGQVAIDPARAVATADQSVASQALSGLQLIGSPQVSVVGRQVCVALSGRVRPVFGRSIPGFGAGTVVTARATATAAGDQGPTVEQRRIC